MRSDDYPEEAAVDVLRSWCLRELAFWLGAKLSGSAVADGFAEANRTLKSVFLVDISGRTAHVRDKPTFYHRTELDDPDSPHSAIDRINRYKRHIEEALAQYGLDLETVIAIDIGDKPHARVDTPIFGFQKERSSPAILLPDIDFLRENFYRNPAFLDQTPYEQKSTSAIFVGSTSGGGLITMQAVRNLSVPRIRSAVYFKGNQDVEFRLPAIVQCDSVETEDLIRSLGICGDRVAYVAQFHHKFIISIDGNGATCSRIAVALRSNSVLLKYESPNVLYYFDRLIPWVHYIPIFQDRDVQNAIALERESPGIFASIAQASTEFCTRFLSSSMINRYTATLLTMYAASLDSRSGARIEPAEIRAEMGQQTQSCDALSTFRTKVMSGSSLRRGAVCGEVVAGSKASRYIHTTHMSCSTLNTKPDLREVLKVIGANLESFAAAAGRMRP